MKKTLITLSLLAGAATVPAQEQINFNAYTSNLKLAIYNQQSVSDSTFVVTYGGYSTYEQVGGSASDIPVGTIVYLNGPGLTGNGYSAQLLVGPAGISSADGSVGGAGLLAYGTPLNFRASPGGFISGSEIITLPALSFFSPGDAVSVAIAAWNNQNGTLLTLAAAQASGSPWGISPVAQTSALSGTPLSLPDTLESFSLGVVPEPNTVALGVFGATAFLLRRRK